MATGFTPDKDKRHSLLDENIAKMLDKIGGDEFSPYIGWYCGIFTQIGYHTGRVVHANAKGMYLNPYLSNQPDAYGGLNYDIKDNPEAPIHISQQLIGTICPYTQDDREGMRILDDQKIAGKMQREANDMKEEINRREMYQRLRELKRRESEESRSSIILIEGYYSKRP